MTQEPKATVNIDTLFIQAAWHVCGMAQANKLRALIQVATESGKAIACIYRLIKFAGAKCVRCLVDRGNLGRQTKKELDQYTSPCINFKFGEERAQALRQSTFSTAFSIRQEVKKEIQCHWKIFA